MLGMLATLASPWLLNHSMTQLVPAPPPSRNCCWRSPCLPGARLRHAGGTLLQLALKMHVPIRRLLAESLLAKVMKLGGKS